MKIATILPWAKTRPRYMLAAILLPAAAYAVDRWFLSGLMASKWIGLPQYESQMRELQTVSRKWGTVALVLEIVGTMLVLPPWPKLQTNQARASVLSGVINNHLWTGYLVRCILQPLLFPAGSAALAILIPLFAGFILLR